MAVASLWLPWTQAWAAAPRKAAEPQLPVSAAASPIILDAGHGGKDLGAVVKGVREKDLALAITRKLKAALERTGRAVRLTRESDTYVELDERVDKSLSWDGSVFVSLHLDEVRDRRPSGMTVYAFGEEKRRRGHFGRRRRVTPLASPSREKARAGAALAAWVARGLRGEGFAVDADRAAYYVLKNPQMPSILIELGYLSNPQEAARLSDPAHQDRIAASLARSLTHFLASQEAPRPSSSLAAR